MSALAVIAGTMLAVALLAGCKPNHPVTGKDDSGPTWHGTQSETAAAVAYARGQHIFISTYNDDTDDGKIVYSANDRVVYPAPACWAGLTRWTAAKTGLTAER